MFIIKLKGHGHVQLRYNTILDSLLQSSFFPFFHVSFVLLLHIFSSIIRSLIFPLVDGRNAVALFFVIWRR